MGNTSGYWLKRVGGAIDKASYRCIRVALTVLSIAVASLVGIELLSRNIIQYPLVFIEDVVVYIVVWMYMLGAIYGTYKRDHLKGGILHVFLKRKPGILRGFRFGNVLLSLGLCCLMSVWGWQSFLWDLQFGPETQILLLPLAFARLSLFVGFTLISVYFFVELVDITRDLLSHSTSDI